MQMAQRHSKLMEHRSHHVSPRQNGRLTQASRRCRTVRVRCKAFLSVRLSRNCHCVGSMERGAPIERVTTVTALISGLSLRQRLANLIHPSVGEDEDERARHEHFIVTRLIVAFVALTALPLYLAVFGVPSLAQL